MRNRLSFFGTPVLVVILFSSFISSGTNYAKGIPSSNIHPNSVSLRHNVTSLTKINENHENITNSTSRAIFQGKINFNKLPSINNTSLKENRRSFEDFLPGNMNLYSILKSRAPSDTNVSTNVAKIPPLTKNLRNFTTHIPLFNLNNTISNSTNVRNVTVQPSGTTSGIATSGYVGLISNKSCGDCTPPDVQIAVGENQVVQMINNFASVWSKDRHQLEKVVSINDLFRLGKNDSTSDPYVLYDFSSHRWFSSVMLTNNNVSKAAVLVAVSTTNNPREDWNIIKFNVTDYYNQSACPDRPIISTTQDKLVISVNYAEPVNGSCFIVRSPAAGVEIMIANKDQTTNNRGTATDVKIIHDTLRITFVPAKTNQGTKLYLVSVGWDSAYRLKIMSIDGTNPKIRYLCSLRSFANTTNFPPNGHQPGTNILIDTADNRILDATYNEGKIWFAFNDSCRSGSSDLPRSCFRLVKVDVADQNKFHDCNDETTLPGKISLDFDVGHNDTYYYRPSIQTDSAGNLFVVFGYSSDSIFPSLAVLKLSELDAGTISINAILLKAGTKNTANEWQLFEQGQKCPGGDPCSRYGDYFSAVTDPLDPASIWVSGQYYENSMYSTYIAKVFANGR